MPILIRQALPEDAKTLASLSRMATHGVLDVFYGDLVEGKSIEDAIVDRRILRDGHVASLPYWSVAVSEEGTPVGAINVFPFDTPTDPDPLVPAERLQLLAPLGAFDEQAAGSFYINALATDPQYRGRGIGRHLIEHALEEARRASFKCLTLYTFEEDVNLVSWYVGLGFRVRDRCPVIPHPSFQHTGYWVLMERKVD